LDKDVAPTGLGGFSSEGFYKDIAPTALGRRGQQVGLKIGIMIMIKIMIKRGFSGR
jgi:hypothetical protein